MSEEEFKEFLKGNVEIPLFKDRYQNLVIMNNFLRERKMSFYELIKNFYNDEDLIDFIISNFFHILKMKVNIKEEQYIFIKEHNF